MILRALSGLTTFLPIAFAALTLFDQVCIRSRLVSPSHITLQLCPRVVSS
jgi:hypothetical protein